MTVHPEAAIDRGDPARPFLVAGSRDRRGAREAQTGTAESTKGRVTPRSTCYPLTGEPNGAWPGQESGPSGCQGHGERKPPRGHGLGRAERPGGGPSSQGGAREGERASGSGGGLLKTRARRTRTKGWGQKRQQGVLAGRRPYMDSRHQTQNKEGRLPLGP